MNYAAAAKGRGGPTRAPVNYAAAAQAKAPTQAPAPAAAPAAPPANAWGAAPPAPAAPAAPAWGAAPAAGPTAPAAPTAPSAASAWGAAPAAPTAPAVPAWGAAPAAPVVSNRERATGPAVNSANSAARNNSRNGAAVSKPSAVALSGCGSRAGTTVPIKQSKGPAIPTKQSKITSSASTSKFKTETLTPTFNCFKCGIIDQSDLTEGCVIALTRRQGKGYLYVRGEWDGEHGAAEVKRTDGAMALVHDEQFESCFNESEVMFVFQGVYCDGDVVDGSGRHRYCAPKSATVRSTVDFHDVHPDSIRCEPDENGNFPQQMSTWEQEKESEPCDQKRDDGEETDEYDPLSAVLGFQSWKQY